jgi:hypothetical protein
MTPGVVEPERQAPVALARRRCVRAFVPAARLAFADVLIVLILLFGIVVAAGGPAQLSMRSTEPSEYSLSLMLCRPVASSRAVLAKSHLCRTHTFPIQQARARHPCRPSSVMIVAFAIVAASASPLSSEPGWIRTWGAYQSFLS